MPPLNDNPDPLQTHIPSDAQFETSLGNAVHDFLSAPSDEPDAPAPDAVPDAPPAKSDAIPDDFFKAPVKEAPEDADFERSVSSFDPKQKAAILAERARTKELKAALEAAKEEVRAAKTQSADPTKSAALEAQLTQVQAERDAAVAKRDELEAQVGQLDLSRSEKFKQEFDYKANALFSRAMRLLVQDGVEQKEAAKILRDASNIAKPSDRERFLAENIGGAVGTVSSVLAQIDEVRENRQLALDNWAATAASMKSSSQSEGRVRTTQMVEADVTSAVEAMQADNNWFYQESAKSPDWNAKVAERKELLKGTLVRADNKEIARLVADGIAAPEVRKLYVELRQRHGALVGKLSERERLALGLRGVSQDGAAAPSKSKLGISESAQTPEDAVMSLLS